MIVFYKKLFITLKHWYCLNKLTLKGLSIGLLSMKEKVEKNCLSGEGKKKLPNTFAKHFIMALKTFCIQIFKKWQCLFISKKVFISQEQLKHNPWITGINKNDLSNNNEQGIHSSFCKADKIQLTSGKEEYIFFLQCNERIRRKFFFPHFNYYFLDSYKTKYIHNQE